MTAEIIRIDDRRPPPAAEKAFDEALRLWRAAKAEPSFRNMADAVDAWRAWERLVYGRAVT